MPWTSRRSARRPPRNALAAVLVAELAQALSRDSAPAAWLRSPMSGRAPMRAARARPWRSAAWRAAAGWPCARRGSRWGCCVLEMEGVRRRIRLGRSERQADSVIESAHASRFRPAAVRKHRLVRVDSLGCRRPMNRLANLPRPPQRAKVRARARGSRPRRRRRASPPAARTIASASVPSLT